MMVVLIEIIILAAFLLALIIAGLFVHSRRENARFQRGRAERVEHLKQRLDEVPKVRYRYR